MGAPQIVIDANVLISALLKDGRTRQILANNSEFEFCVPMYFRSEFLKYSGEFAIRLNKPEAEIRMALKQLIESAKIKEFRHQEYADFIPEAKLVSPDPKDVPYFALAIKLGAPFWTSDKRLQNQQRVRIIGTAGFGA